MIIEDNHEKIKSFSEYLNEKLTNIDELTSNDQILFKKILYVSFLDSLSACLYPERGNKERFTNLIEKFSQWEHRDHICLLHISKMVSVTSDPALEKIRSFAKDEMSKWLEICDRRGVIKIEQTPKIEDIKEKWSRNEKGSGLKYSLVDFKHSSLLYQLRNSLVHQFQARGNELGVFLPDNPYYQVVKSFDDKKQLKPVSIHLVYPATFLKKLCHTTLDNVIKYFYEGNINPFPHYYAGEYWLDGLNR